MSLEMLLYSEVERDVDKKVAYYLQRILLFQDIKLYYVDKATREEIQGFLPSTIEVNDDFIYGLEEILKKVPTILVVDREIKSVGSRYVTYSIASPWIYYDGSFNEYQPFIILSWKKLRKYPRKAEALEFFLFHEMGHLFGLVPDKAPNLADRFHHCKHKYCVMYHLNLSRQGNEHIDYIKRVNPNIYCERDYRVLQKRIKKIERIKKIVGFSSFFSFLD